jgi:hypothetical protein
MSQRWGNGACGARSAPRVARFAWNAVLASLLVASACDRRAGTLPETRGVIPIATLIERHSAEWMAIPGVAGVYEGETRAHVPCIRIMVVRRTPELESKLPRSVAGHPVEIEETGEIRPMSGSR